MRPGQNVTFRVDAYPTDTFHGTVKQVRLNPTTVQNVVTYSTVIDVPNPDYRLKPGMTANVNIEIARRTNVMRVPNAALRFRPTKDIFEALHQTMPPELERGFGRGQGGRQNAGGQGPSGQPGAPGAPAANPTGGATGGGAPSGQTPRPTSGQSAAQNAQPSSNPAQQNAARQGTDGQPGSNQNANNGGRGGFANMTPEQREERRKRMEERMASMSPDERAQFEERMRQRQQNGGGGSYSGNGAGNFGGGRGGGSVSANGGASRSGGATAGNTGKNAAKTDAAAGSKPSSGSNATTIDSLFAPLPQVETRGRAWLYINKELKMVNLRLGISDGTFTEVINDTELQPDMDVVTSVVTPEMASRPANQQNQNNGNPLMPQRGRPGGPGGNRGGGR
jgi:hypothetical protein